MSGNSLIEGSWDSQDSQVTVAHKNDNPEDESVVNEEAFLFEEKDGTYKADMDLDDPACNELLGADNGEETDLCANAEAEPFTDVSMMDVTQENIFANNGEQEEQTNDEQMDKSETCEDGTNKAERTGVISLAATTARDSIPDTLEISKEQAAQLKQYLPKFNRGRGRGRDQGRPTLRNPGTRPRMGLLQNPQALLGQVFQSLLGQQPRMGFPFPGGPQNRGPFPGGLLNPQGPQNPRGPFMNPRIPAGPLNTPFSGPQRGPFPGRFPGAPNQRGLFFGGRQSVGPNRPAGLQPGSQIRPQGLLNQRVGNPNQFMQRPPLLGQQGIRIPNSGPRPLLGSAGPGGRFIRPGQNSAATQQALMNQVANALKSSMGAQQMRPPLMMPNNRPPAQQIRPLQGLNRFQHPAGQLPGNPRFPPRIPGPGNPFLNSSMIRGNQQNLLNGHGGLMLGNQKMGMNPRFQMPFGAAGIGNPFRMGAPMQQRNSKGIFDRNKPGTPMNLAGLKRKATDGDVLPTKVAK
ncbi:hypothetical protein BsWGS_01341 [Bradybaena similaris]